MAQQPSEDSEDYYEHRVKRHEYGTGRAKVQAFPEDEENESELYLLVKNGRSLQGSEMTPEEARETAQALLEAADHIDPTDDEDDDDGLYTGENCVLCLAPLEGPTELDTGVCDGCADGAYDG